MTLTKTTTHVAEAQARLVQQFKDAPDFEAWLAAYVVQIQELENMFFQLLLDRVIETAVGIQLDGIGAIVGEDRKGKSDASYRTWIRGRILANRSSGTPEEMLELAGFITAQANGLAIEEYHPAGFNLILSDALVEDIDDVSSILNAASPAGVRAYVEYRESAESLTFSFASGDTTEASVTQGFADTVPAEEFVTNDDFAAWAGGDPDDWVVTETLPNSEVSEVGAGMGHGGGGNGLCNIYSAAGVDVGIKQDIVVIPGASYTLQFLIDTFTVTTGRLRVSDLLGAEFDEVYTTPGIKTINFTPSVATIRLELDLFGAAALDVTIDNVSLTVTGVGGEWAGVEEI